MNCPKCNSTLLIASNKFVSDVGTTEVHSEMQLVCVHPECDNFAGTDLNNPSLVVQTLRNKAN